MSFSPKHKRKPYSTFLIITTPFAVSTSISCPATAPRSMPPNSTPRAIFTEVFTISPLICSICAGETEPSALRLKISSYRILNAVLVATSVFCAVSTFLLRCWQNALTAGNTNKAAKITFFISGEVSLLVNSGRGKVLGMRKRK